jgi:type II secretion system protein G
VMGLPLVSIIALDNDNKKGNIMKKGFTLMEILIAIAIIAVLTAIGIVSYTSINKNARNAKRRSDVEQIRSALELYRADYGYYPAVNTMNMGVASNLNDDVVVVPPFTPYLTIPTDPKGLDYMYKAIRNTVNSQYYEYCLAASMELASNTIDSTCGTESLGDYNYGRKNP